MAAYILVDIVVKDPATYERYKQLAQTSLPSYGGRYLVRGGATQSLEGDWPLNRFVLLEFPDAERARAWWASPEYAAAKALRHASAHTRMALAEGL